jgi:hypothetical protein
MFKKDELEEFLFLFNKAENIPFSNYEDALVNNYNALDAPFIDYYNSIKGWCDYLKIEISENLLSLPVDEKLLYIKYVEHKLKFESWDFNNKNLIDVLKYYNIDNKNLDIKKNKKLKELLHKSFKTVSGDENLIKLRDLHKGYYQYILNIERDKILNYLNGLIENLESNITTEKVNFTNTNPIFVNPNRYQIFIKLLDFLNIKDTTTRGNQAKLAGIFQTSPSNKAIFKSSTTKKQYLDYLNSIYDSNFTTKSFSDGSNYERTIEKWISEQEL